MRRIFITLAALVLATCFFFAYSQATTQRIPLQTPITNHVFEFVDGEAEAVFTIEGSETFALRVIGFEGLEFELRLPDGSVFNTLNTVSGKWESALLTLENSTILFAPKPTLFLSAHEPLNGTYVLKLIRKDPTISPPILQFFDFNTNRPTIRNALMVGEVGDPRFIFSQGEAIPVSLAVFKDTEAVNGLEVTLRLHNLNTGKRLHIALLDDGIAPDALANDGVYSGTIQLEEKGRWRLSVEDTQNIVGRTSHISIEQPDLRLTGEVFDEGIDSDNDGEWDAIQLTFPTTGVASSDKYFISVSLQNSEGNMISISENFRTGEAIRVIFPTVNPRRRAPPSPQFPRRPTALEDLGARGSYDIVKVVFEAETITAGEQSYRLLHMIEGAGTTAYYTNFETRDIAIHDIVDYGGIDEDGDGFFDGLEVVFEVSTKIAGSYTFSASLYSVDKRVGIETKYLSPISLSTGSQLISVEFTGALIGALESQGILKIRQASLYGFRKTDPNSSEVDGPNLNARAFELGEIYYDSFDFDDSIPGSMFSLKDFVQYMPINIADSSADTLRNELLSTLAKAEQASEAKNRTAFSEHMKTFNTMLTMRDSGTFEDSDLKIIAQAIPLIEKYITWY